jgi:hypothetical protein
MIGLYGEKNNYQFSLFSYITKDRKQEAGSGLALTQCYGAPPKKAKTVYSETTQ